VGELAVGADPEELRAFLRELVLPPGELQDLGGSDEGKIERVEEEDDPLPPVVGQHEFPELLPRDPFQLERGGRALHLHSHARSPFDGIESDNRLIDGKEEGKAGGKK
jgi:hypothetical protein